MACLILDGMDNLDVSPTLNGTDQAKWDVSGSGVESRMGEGRFGSKAIYADGTDYFYRSLAGALGHASIGFAFKLNSSDIIDLLVLKTGATKQFSLTKQAITNKLVLRNGAGTVIANFETIGLKLNVWHFASIEFDIGNSADVDLYLNGELYSLTSIDTQSHASTSTFDTVELYGPCWYDDFYLFDSTSAYNTTMVADCAVYTQVPVYDYGGTWTAATGTSKSVMVDDYPYISTYNDYIYTGTAGNTMHFYINSISDGYRIIDEPVTSEILAIAANMYMKRDTDTSTTPVVGVDLLDEATSTHSVTAVSVTHDDYKNRVILMDYNPLTSTNWTMSEVITVASVIFGVKLTSNS